MRFLLVLSLIWGASLDIAVAQVPQKFSFQGVIRGEDGKALSSGTTVAYIRFTIHKNAADGTIVYDETHHNVILVTGGIFNAQVGAGDQINSGVFGVIEWSKDNYYLQVQFDLGDGNIHDLGSVQLLSVPYAQHATTANSWTHNESVVQTGAFGVDSLLKPSGEGARLIWYPRRAAFRVGFSALDHWADANIGGMSFATGSSTRATGTYSAAFGLNSNASGGASVAMGMDAHAMGLSSVASGVGTYAKSYGATTVGVYNNDEDPFGPGTNPEDRLFQIGNGTTGARSNALTVLVNGHVGIGNNAVAPTHLLDIGGRARIRHNGATAGMFFDNSVSVPTGFVGMITDQRMGFYLGKWRLQIQDNGAISSGFGNAIGDESVAWGPGATAKAFGAVVVGPYNNVQDNAVATLAGAKNTDRIFQIGNGWGEQALSNALTVLRNGNIGIGNDAVFPTYLLEVGGRPRILHSNNATAGIHFDNSQHVVDGFVGMKTDDQVGFYLGNSWKFWVDNGGNGFINGAVVQTSDRRLKRDFTPLSASLEKFTHLQGYHYYWKDKDRDQSLQTGLIAQDVEALFPELVKTDEKGFKSLNYTGLIPHLIESVKELAKQNAKLEAENAAFRADSRAINQKLAAIEARLGQLSSPRVETTVK